jgi:hypothetical protein
MKKHICINSLKQNIMYIKEILWLVSWPVLIYLSYKLAFIAIKSFEKNQENI